MNQTKMFAVCGVLGAAAGVASAQDVILQDGSAIATFSETTAGGYFQTAWEINGVNQLADQSFFVVVDDTVFDLAFDLTPVFVSTSDLNFDFADETLVVAYEVGGLDIEIEYVLTGSDDGATLAESITITNLTDDAIDASFIQFADFDLNGDLLDSVAGITDNVITQSDGATTATESFGESVTTPPPTTTQFGDPADLIADIFTTGQLDGSIFAENGDLAFAAQWDFTVAADGELGSSFQISKIKSVVPTPGVAMLFGTAGLMSVRRRR